MQATRQNLSSGERGEPIAALPPAAEPAPVEASDQPADHAATGGEQPSGEAVAGEPGIAAEAAETSDEAGNGSVTEIEEDKGEDGEEDIVESVGGADAMEEVPERTQRLRRQYKIQEVIKRRQIMLVQVVKEERGTKGAALTTYLSLAGRYSVLMPNTARGGGISRKITNVQDRKRLKEIAQELEVPEGMGVILRTAGAARTKTEVKRDFEYLLRMWETVRDVTLKSSAPTLVYEEGSLVKRSIRDLYSKDIDEVITAGDNAYREAKDFMRMLMPSHAKNVKPYHDGQPLFTRFGIENQLDAMFSPIVQLRSGGYIVLNQTEALVAIDVNSGRATREHHIEDTALKTNLEASEEIARQLRLRDLAGLIVIDFIDMDEKRNNRAVERRLKECLKNDRARIQVGRISHFGLMEMSRQRIRTSVLESTTDKCPHCGGSGHVRSVASVSLQLLRNVEETLLRGATHNLTIRTRSEIALYVLNHKRAHLRDLEDRFRITITVSADPEIGGQQPFLIEKGEQVHTAEQAKALALQPIRMVAVEAEEEEEEEEEAEIEREAEAAEDEASAEYAEGAEGEEADEGARVSPAEGEPDGNGGRKRRRRRRRGRRGEGREGGPFTHETVAEHAIAHEDHDAGGDEDHDAPSVTDTGEPVEPEAAGAETEARRHRRRGRRGGRRSRRPEGDVQYSPPEPEFAPVDEEIAHAVADFGGPLLEPQPPTAEPAQTESVAPAHEPEVPRRRSTVREPAPFVIQNDAPPVATSAQRGIVAAKFTANRRRQRNSRPRRSSRGAPAGGPSACWAAIQNETFLSPAGERHSAHRSGERGWTAGSSTAMPTPSSTATPTCHTISRFAFTPRGSSGAIRASSCTAAATPR